MDSLRTLLGPSLAGVTQSAGGELLDHAECRATVVLDDEAGRLAVVGRGASAVLVVDDASGHGTLLLNTLARTTGLLRTSATTDAGEVLEVARLIDGMLCQPHVNE